MSKGCLKDFVITLFNEESDVYFKNLTDGKVIRLGKFIKYDTKVISGNLYDGWFSKITLYFDNGEYSYDSMTVVSHQTPIFKEKI